MKTSTETGLHSNHSPIDNFDLAVNGNLESQHQKIDFTRQNSTQEIQTLSGFQPVNSLSNQKDKYGVKRNMFSPVWAKTHQNINFI